MKESASTIYGIHAVEEALQSDKEINKIIVAKGAKHALIEELMKQARKKGITVQMVPKDSYVFPKQRNHQGIVAFISPVVYHQIEDIIPQLFEQGINPTILVLDHITDVRNFGSIARTALCMGINAIVIQHQSSVQVTDDAVKTSAGALLTIPVCRVQNMKTTMELLNQSGITTVGLSEKANKEIPFADLSGPVALIVGNEESGLSNDVLKRCTQLVKIPMKSTKIGSLNVANAAAIAMYERVKQMM
jgi:23S rRNA (guanosine2251-2'-O)-methyltransferase